MKGALTTQTLRGLLGLEPFHWRGDRTNFLQFNGAFASLLGGTTLPSTNMAAYRDFINSVVFEPNPNQNLDRTLPASFGGANPIAGRNDFLFTNYVTGPVGGGLACAQCHTAPPGFGTDELIIPAAILQQSQDFKVPHLRNAYQKMSFNNAPGTNSTSGFGFFPDGFGTLFSFLGQPAFANTRTNVTFKNDVAAFVQCFDTGTAPAVGYTRTVTAANVNTAGISNDWNLLETQAALLTNCDLIVKGTIDGARHGLLYQPASQFYKSDMTNAALLTRAQLVAKILAGDKLSIIGVPPGSGTRMGIDRDEDGKLDGDTPAPALQLTLNSGSSVISWPLRAAGYTLETSTDFASGWAPVTNPVEIISNQNFTTNSLGGAKFYRLHFAP